MKTLRLLFIISLFSNGVFGDAGEVKTVSVMEGDSLTLHTDLTELLKTNRIVWTFKSMNNSVLAKFNIVQHKISLFEVTDKRFSNRLRVNNQTGDLTITNIRTEHSGDYEVEIRGAVVTTTTFSVGVFGDTDDVKTVSVMEGDSLTLNTGTNIQTDDQTVWKLLHTKKSVITEIIGRPGKPPVITDGRFRDRLQLHQNGSLTISNMTNEDSGLYDVDMTINRTYTVHKTFRVTVYGAGVSRGESSGVSSGVIAGICVSLLLLVIAAAVAVAIYYRHKFFEVKLPVKEGEPVTLHTDVTELNTDDEIEWRFQKTVIATIKRNNENIDERFRDRRTLSSQSGSLTIKATRTSDSGLYTRKLIRGRKTSYKRFRLTVTDSADSVAINQPLMNSDTQQL